MDTSHIPNTQKGNIGVSSCILGHAVRYDGKHKYHPIITAELSQYFTLIPFCPEVAIGMGVPRPPMHLVTLNRMLHAVDKVNSALDYTQQLSSRGNQYLRDNSPLHGYIFQDKSPSCGVKSVKVFDEDTVLTDTQGTGIFASAILAVLPELPIIEACSLDDPKAVADFVQRVRDYQQQLSIKAP